MFIVMGLPSKYCLILALVALAISVHAQPCTVSSTIMHPAVLPNDTLEIDGAVPGSDVLQVVLPKDTTLFGFLLAYDSIDITGNSGLLGSMTAITHTGTPQAQIRFDTTQQFRTCLTVSHPQVMGYSPGYPAYLKLGISIEAYVTTPFGNQSAIDTLKIHYRVHNADSVVPVRADVAQSSGIGLYPNPATQLVRLDYVLSEVADVTVCVTDMLGHEVHAWSADMQGVGPQSRILDISEWPAGAYLVAVQVGTARTVRKLIKLE
jgi:Secretion system C-terminal sorting domain